jgi:glycosyltransferase involved in cell wall biosynthesis
MPSVSILIPCYNAERWIGQAIQSALDQTHTDKEIVVVDDGSTDGSLAIIKKFGAAVILESGPNRGGNVARNTLLSMASGEWIQFLDADDYLRPIKVASQLQSLDSLGGNADVIYSPVITEVWRGSEIMSESVGVIDANSSLEEQWIRWQVAQTGSLLWRRRAIQSIGGWNETYPCCQDNEIALRAIQNGLKLHLYNCADAVYRIWSQETVCRKDPARVIYTKTHLIDYMLEWLNTRGRLTREELLAARQMCFEMGRMLAVTDMFAATEYHLQRSQMGLWKPAGPAAPLHYRVVHRMFGFHFAERVAKYFRSRVDRYGGRG